MQERGNTCTVGEESIPQEYDAVALAFGKNEGGWCRLNDDLSSSEVELTEF